MILTRSEILGAEDITTERVAVPEWGGDVLVAVLPGTERWEFDVWLSKAGETTEHVVRLVALTAVDEHGARLFTEDDLKALGQKSGVALVRVFRAAMKLNRIGTEGVDDAKGES